MLFLFLDTPPAVMQEVLQELPPAVVARVRNLEAAKDWAGLSDYLEGLPPREQGVLLETRLRALGRAGRWERAVGVADAALPKIEPKGPVLSPTRLFRAQALSAQGRHREAMAAHALNGKLGWVGGWASACGEAKLLQDWEAMVTQAEAYLGHPEAKRGLGLSWKGEALFLQGKPREAEPVLQEAIRAGEAPAMTWANLAGCLNLRRAFTEAVEAGNRALAREPGLMEALYNRGSAYLGLKRVREGREDLAAALATGRADATLRRVIEQTLAQADRYLASEARKTSPSRKR